MLISKKREGDELIEDMNKIGAVVVYKALQTMKEGREERKARVGQRESLILARWVVGRPIAAERNVR